MRRRVELHGGDAGDDQRNSCCAGEDQPLAERRPADQLGAPAATSSMAALKTSRAIVEAG